MSACRLVARRSGRGFTLLELVVALAIVAILLTVAITSFFDHLARQARSEAQAVLVETVEWMGQQHQLSGSYAVARLPKSRSPERGEALYEISLATTAVAAVDPRGSFPVSDHQSFTLQAVPLKGDACGTLLIDQYGRRGVTGAGATVAGCWQ